MTVAVIDDEQHCIDRILALLEPYRKDMKISCFHTAEEAIAGIEAMHPEIVLLDVQLREKTGFDVLSAIPYRDFCLIFTTAYDQYAIEAFKFSAIDYLLKPIVSEDFDHAIEKAFKKIEQTHLNERVNLLMSHLSPGSLPRKICIPSRDGYIFLNISDIVRCEADVNYTHIFTSDEKMYTISKPLKHMEALLARHDFFRIHNAYLINLNCVKAYAKSGYVTLLDNTHLEVSVRRKDAFLKVCDAFFVRFNKASS